MITGKLGWTLLKFCKLNFKIKNMLEQQYMRSVEFLRCCIFDSRPLIDHFVFVYNYTCWIMCVKKRDTVHSA